MRWIWSFSRSSCRCDMTHYNIFSSSMKLVSHRRASSVLRRPIKGLHPACVPSLGGQHVRRWRAVSSIRCQRAGTPKTVAVLCAFFRRRSLVEGVRFHVIVRVSLVVPAYAAYEYPGLSIVPRQPYHQNIACRQYRDIAVHVMERFRWFALNAQSRDRLPV